jgi:hypothetical protein
MYPALRFWKSAAKNLSANDGSFDSIRLTLWMIFIVSLQTQSESPIEISFSLYRTSKGNTELVLIKVYT